MIKKIGGMEVSVSFQLNNEDSIIVRGKTQKLKLSRAWICKKLGGTWLWLLWEVQVKRQVSQVILNQGKENAMGVCKRGRRQETQSTFFFWECQKTKRVFVLLRNNTRH